MCEIFGITARERADIRPQLREFFSHAVRHPNGWGLALCDQKPVVCDKEAIRADQSEALARKLKEPVLTRAALAHIRYATIGDVEWENCHPFIAQDKTGRTWTLIHNGTIFDYPALSIYTRLQRGQTDSERILLYLIDRMNDLIDQEGEPNDRMRFALLDEIITDMAPKNKLNLLIYDGEQLYAHTNCADTLFIRACDTGCMLSTCPLETDGWEPVPMLQLFAYRQGDELAHGAKHEGEYHEDKEDMANLYLAYSGL